MGGRAKAAKAEVYAPHTLGSMNARQVMRGRQAVSQYSWRSGSMLRSLNGSTPIANTKPVRTADYSVELQHSRPATLPAIYHNLHVVTVCLSGELLVVREGAGNRSSTQFVRGESGIRSAGPGQQVTWPAGAHCLYVHLHPRVIRRLGQAILGTPGVGLETRPWLRDPVIRDIGLQLHEVVTIRRSLDPRVVHDLVMALAHHVVVRYPAEAGPGIHIGRLSIEETLDTFREGTLNWAGVTALANRCGLTRSHFSRRICSLTGMSPSAMVLGSRIEAAKHLLERCNISLAEVAYTAGFADQSHLTRAFRRASGITPARYRAIGTGVPR